MKGWWERLLRFVGSFGSDPEKVAQAAHALAGFASASTLGMLGTIVIVGPWGILKEAYIDPKYEHAPFFWNGATDLLFYVIGAAWGEVYYLARFGKTWPW